MNVAHAFTIRTCFEFGVSLYLSIKLKCCSLKTAVRDADISKNISHETQTDLNL